MFRQVMVDSRDWAYQQILWTSSQSSSVVPYHLTTVTYGLGPAPYLSNRVLKQLATDEGSIYPLAVDILNNITYVDDTFGGADSIEEAQSAVIQLDKLCMAGGFHLQKWTANNSNVLSTITPERCAIKQVIQLQETQYISTLGICWQPEEDCFVFSSPFSSTSSSTPTKRSILSNISRFFDPLGWISPVTIQAKILMQDIWLSKSDWDEVVNEDLAARWSKFINDLNNVNNISIPRWVGISPTNLGIEIHGFSDASEHAMAAVIYLRIITEFDSVSVHLIEAKTKVAPTKRQTIPRLELNAALILTKRVAHFKSILNLNHVSTHLWTDSSVALTWIKGHPSRWKDYVANRVLKIQDVLPHAKWHHIPGKCNPADCASRGIAVQQLIEHPLWWHGPLWLLNHSSSWPSADINLGNINLEERLSHRTVNIVRRHQEEPIWDLINKFSKLTRLIRITAICRRVFSKNYNKSIIKQPLSPKELEHERRFWIKLTQNSYFSSEIKALHAGQQLQNSHPLSKFTPFIDAYGLLRVGGRLRNALIDPNAKHPILLPSKSTFTNLLIAEAHEKTLHGGVQVMSVYLWQSYWILGGRSAIKAFNHRCVRCAKIRGVTARQLMGQLPSIRTIPARPFLHSGVDYAGPLSIKTWRGRGAKQYKGYIALFVCLSTSAVHLEVASDYSVDGFLAAFKRFVSRRGVCSTLTSDCGTNFIGADAELKRLFTQCSKEYSKLSTILANDGTQWKFNPPSAPHFGGKWEASVKSVKFHLRRIIGDTALTYEELTTLLAQIEAVLNSLSLSDVRCTSDDPDVNAILLPTS
ncbi:uncharacterized protein LOC124420591 [Lucilia cuprina]|uniref:uncharacterized protein LOC124420591 n=1 Tax=Lucilia cuprina TaxID=7375 RepID=UPI001F063730|nr:uncharacterized protein LOC124420591 [Lucilia cuprina]